MTPEYSYVAATSRPQSRYLGLIGCAIILITATLTIPRLAGASTYQGGWNVSVGENEQVEGNLYLSGLQVDVDGNAPGDVYIVAANADLNGDVGGGLTVVSVTADIAGSIEGSVHVVSGRVEIRSTIDGDLIVAGGQVILSPGSNVGGDVILAGGTVNVDGTVDGTVYGATVSTMIEGEIAGNVELQATHLEVTNGSRIAGHLRYQSSLDADVSNTAAIGGETVRTNQTPWTGVGDGALVPFGSLLRLTWALIAGATLVGIAPRIASRISIHGGGFLQPSAIGLIGIVAVPVLSFLAILSLVGIPVGIILLVLLVITVYFSQISTGLIIGRYLMPRSWQDGSRGALLLAMTVGVLIIALLRMVPVPYIGSIVTALVTFWGTGAAILVVTDLTSRRLRESSV